MEIMRIYYSIAIISFFWIDVPSSSKCIWFGTKMSGTEVNYEVELGEIF